MSRVSSRAGWFCDVSRGRLPREPGFEHARKVFNQPRPASHVNRVSIHEGFDALGDRAASHVNRVSSTAAEHPLSSRRARYVNRISMAFDRTLGEGPPARCITVVTSVIEPDAPRPRRFG